MYDQLDEQKLAHPKDCEHFYVLDDDAAYCSRCEHRHVLQDGEYIDRYGAIMSHTVEEYDIKIEATL